MTNTQDEVNTLNYKKLTLKVQALLETNNTLTNTNADHRADITMLSDYASELQNEIANLKQELAEVRNGLVEENSASDATGTA